MACNISFRDHSISLCHLQGSSTWHRIHLLGVSGSDNLLYLVACGHTEVAIFSGSPLLPNSWKMTHRFPFDLFHCQRARFAFSNDFTQMALVGELLSGFGGSSIFALFDLQSNQCHQRKFLFPNDIKDLYTRADYQLFHTSIGWLTHFGYNMDHSLTVFRLSLNEEKNCLESLCRMTQPRSYASILNRPIPLFASKDCLFWFHYRERFMSICRLDSDTFIWERYNMDSIILLDRSNTFFWNDIPTISGVICECLPGQMCPRESDKNKGADSKVYQCTFDSTAKYCLLTEIGNFHQMSQFFSTYYFTDQMVMWKSKRFALHRNIERKLLLINTFCYKPLSLKELCSLAIVKKLCQKSQIAYNNIFGDQICVSVDVWNGGPSEEVKYKLGLLNSTLHFGKIQ